MSHAQPGQAEKKIAEVGFLEHKYAKNLCFELGTCSLRKREILQGGCAESFASLKASMWS